MFVTPELCHKHWIRLFAGI